MKTLLVTAMLALMVAGFVSGVLTARAYLTSPEPTTCTQELPNAKVESDLTYPLTPEELDRGARRLNPSFL